MASTVFDVLWAWSDADERDVSEVKRYLMPDDEDDDVFAVTVHSEKPYAPDWCEVDVFNAMGSCVCTIVIGASSPPAYTWH